MSEAFGAAEPGPSAAIADPSDDHRALRLWLWCMAALVFAMVMLGGTTRLTDSGLSITEWRPISGILPPLSAADWAAEFAKYREIPQYRALFSDMDLSGFKYIFLWEWSHRLLGRVLGIVFAVPLAVFWLRGMLPAGYKWKLVGVLILGGFQGFIGWWMVTSGLVHRVEVAQERLAVHLLLGSLTFALLVHLAVTCKPPREALAARADLRGPALVLIIFVLAQIYLGGLVAGLRAGRAYNTWPLMDGQFILPGHVLFALQPDWRNFVDNIAMVQFQHRGMAYVLLIAALTQISSTFRLAPGSLALRRALIFAALIAAQAGIGIMTLLLVVPLWAGLLHQAFAMIVLAFAVVQHAALLPLRAASTAQAAASA